MQRITNLFFLIGSVLLFSSWGFFAHKQINQVAVFSLPPAMIGFYKANIAYLREASVNPDRRRLAVVEEAARHYIDLDHFGDSALYKMPRYWQEAVDKYSADTLKAYGIVPWHVNIMYYRLRDAFMQRDPTLILKLSAELGHYLADANVPLHTTKNYNGQLTGQEGIHGFWESRLPELFAKNYRLFVGKASYVNSPQQAVWEAIATAHGQVDSVFQIERNLSLQYGEKKYSFETRGTQTVRVYSVEFSNAFHSAVKGMTERQMKRSIKLITDFWYSAWVDAGQPNLKELINYKPTEEELRQRKIEWEQWKENQIKVREHESDGE